MTIIVVSIFEVDLFGSLIWYDSLITGLPVGGTYFSMLISKLEGFDETDSLIDGSTDSIVVNLHGSQLALLVDDEKSAQCGTVHGVIAIFD